jgi:hypothetical protein
MSDKLSIANEMAQMDAKNREFYDSLTIEERKKFSNYLMIRWGSCVTGDPTLQAYYLMATNERLNKHFFDIGRHPKLQWLCATTVSPGMGRQRHQWIAPKKKESNNKAVKFLAEIFPLAKSDELELMARLNDTNDLKDLARKHGWDDKRIKSDL